MLVMKLVIIAGLFLSKGTTTVTARTKIVRLCWFGR